MWMDIEATWHFQQLFSPLQVETGSAITWKYPSVILKGDNTVGEFYSVALTNHYQQADTGTKMVHIGKNSRSRIISKGISAGKSRNVYRGEVKIQPGASSSRNFSQCDSMLIGDTAGANTYPYIQVPLKRITVATLIIRLNLIISKSAGQKLVINKELVIFSAVKISAHWILVFSAERRAALDATLFLAPN